MQARLDALILAFMLLCSIPTVVAIKDRNRMCAACHVIVDEIEQEIAKVDPNKVLEVQGFRVDPRGNQNNKKIMYARSETHLTEITESMCNKMNQYAQSTDKETGRIKYVLTQSKDSEPVQLENVSMSSEISEKLRHVCNAIIEDNEENIIEFFKEPSKNPKEEFCVSVAGICESEEENDEEDEREEL